MKGFFCAFMSAILIISIIFSLSGCEKKSKDNNSTKQFNDEKEMAEYLNGVWANADDNWVFISDETMYFYNFDMQSEKMAELFLGEDAQLTLEEQIAMTADEYYEKYYSPYSITYDVENSLIILDGEKLLSVDMIDDTITFVSDFECVEKGSELIKDSDEKFPSDYLRDCFTGAKMAYVSTNKTRGLPSNSDVQYDKSAYDGQNFCLYGDAELEDYYAREYKNLESEYFCMRVKSLNDEYWYVYALRSQFSQLFSDLKDAEYSDKNISITSTCKFKNSDSSFLICELVDVDYIAL